MGLLFLVKVKKNGNSQDSCSWFTRIGKAPVKLLLWPFNAYRLYTKIQRVGRNGDCKWDQDWGHLGLLVLLYIHLLTLGKSSQHWVSVCTCKMRIVIFLFGLDIVSLDCLNIYTEALTPWDPRDLPGDWPGLTPSLSSPADAALGPGDGWECVCWIAQSVLLSDPHSHPETLAGESNPSCLAAPHPLSFRCFSNVSLPETTKVDA